MSRRRNDYDVLCQHGRDLVRRLGKDRVSISCFRKELKVSYNVAQQVWKKLQEEGVLDSPRLGRPAKTVSPPPSRSVSSVIDDTLYDRARELVLAQRRASTIFLQNELRIGQPKARLLMDRLRTEGVVRRKGGVWEVLASPADVLMPAPLSAAGNGQLHFSVVVPPDIGRRLRLAVALAFVDKSTLTEMLRDGEANLATLEQMTQ